MISVKIFYCSVLLLFISFGVLIPTGCSSERSSTVRSKINEDNENSVENIDNFSDGYWVRLAQAKVMALATENGSLPKLDDISKLMIPTNCRHDPAGFDLTTKCATEKADNILRQLNNQEQLPSIRENFTIYLDQISRECVIKFYPFHSYHHNNAAGHSSSIFSTFLPNTPSPVPKFHCNSYKHRGKFETNIRMEYPNHDDLYNLRRDLIPRYFVYEINQNSEWSLPKISVLPYWLFSFPTEPSQSYRIRVTAVSPKHIYPPVTTSPIDIFKVSDLNVASPKDIVVANITKEDYNSKPWSLVRWKSGSGSNASCDFNLFYKHEDIMHVVKRRSAEEAFWAKLDDLEFEGVYGIQVIEKFGGGKETNGSSRFYVPSCLELKGFSFEHCPPPKPENIRMVNATKNEFWIVWDPPKYESATNKIFNYTLDIDWINRNLPRLSGTSNYSLLSSEKDIYGHHDHRNAATLQNIFSGYLPGNETMLLVTNVTDMIGCFKVTVTANAAFGPSEKVVKILKYRDWQMTFWTAEKIVVLVFGIISGAVMLYIFISLCIIFVDCHKV